MKKILQSTLAAVAGLSLLTACAGGGGASESPSAAPSFDAETQALITEAKSAGAVTFYSMIDEASLRVISEDFTARYGVQVEPVRLVTGDLIQRYSAEAASGKAAADVVLMTDSPFFDDALANGWIAPVKDAGVPGASGFPEKLYTHDGATPIVSLIPSEVVLNSDAITAVPADWKIYADPAYKGKIMLAEPDSSPANIAFWSLMKEKYGDGFLREIAANEPKWMGGAVPLTQGIAAGEADLGFPGVAAIVNNLQKSGAPVQLVGLAPTTGPEAAVALSKSSANPAGAKLLASYLMSEDGNKLLNDDTAAISPLDAAASERFTRVSDVQLADVAEIRSLLGLN
ncbi:extracellular solute-binding protein [Arthrobacter ginkgonis]|uniref:Extracellular solute-binding protein n=1 Tax=Arthrobacter ginkgonis TaxID=1630594 RepID=A0ABP7BSE4_9MICC